MCVVSMRTLSLIVGWIHLIFSIISTIGLLVYLCMYNNKTYEDTEIQLELEIIGLHTLILLFLFSVASAVLSALLLKGIAEERTKLMSPFVYLNYLTLGLLIFLAIVSFIADLITGATFGDIMLDLLLRSLIFGLTLLFFWPVRSLYNQMRDNPDQPEQHRLKESIPANQQNYVQSDNV